MHGASAQRKGIMQTKPKSNSTITTTLNDDGTVTFTVLGAGEFKFDPSLVHEANVKRAALHGFVQRVSDGGALGRDKETGASATPEAKLARMKGIADHLMSGTDQWRLVVATAPGLDGGLIIQAVMRAGMAADVDAANALVERLCTKRTIERAAALRVFADVPEVIAAMSAIRAERSKVSAADLMAEMMAE
jgi:hypothetical protein